MVRDKPVQDEVLEGLLEVGVGFLEQGHRLRVPPALEEREEGGGGGGRSAPRNQKRGIQMMNAALGTVLPDLKRKGTL